MGLLSPSGKPDVPAPVTMTAAKPSVRALGSVYRPCDSCGYSHDDKPIARALYQMETLKGSVYLCGHHFRKHSGHIFDKGYPIQELRRSGAPAVKVKKIPGKTVNTIPGFWS